MAEITVLDEATIDKIAAGEVVERPSSVVKELVENALDAGADAVTVEIKDGGLRFIRVTDNGCGIGAEQVAKAFLRHATSKIRSVEDLSGVSSLGFRGEALSSIAAVGQVALVTKTPQELTGVRYVIEGAVEKSREEVGAPTGTTFIVRNLFFNTPVRRKFLKSAMTEGSYVTELVERLALSHPETSFKYVHNGQTKLQTSGNGSLKEVIYHIYGRDTAESLLALETADGPFGVKGYLGLPGISRGNRTYEHFFINGRYFKSGLLSRAVEESYKPFLMQHRYPFVVLHLSVDGEQLDVNVHPTKMEVRFSEQERLYRFISQSLGHQLSSRELIPGVRLSEEKKAAKKPAPVPEPFEARRRQTASAASSLKALDALSKAADAVQREEKQQQPPAGIQECERPQMPATPLLPSGGQTADAAKPPESLPDPKPAQAADDTLILKDIQTAGVVQAQESPQTTEGAQADGSDPAEDAQLVKEYICSVNEATSEPFVFESSIYGEAETPQGGETPQNAAGVSEQVIIEKPAQMSLFDEKFLSQEARVRHRIIGQVFSTYWLVEMDESLYIIDQHAAHEKVLYERLKAQTSQGQAPSQYISPPIVLTLSGREQQLLEKYLNGFQRAGFLVEHFGGDEYTLAAVPTELFGLAGRDFFLELLDGLSEDGGVRGAESADDRIATMSCKAAVKGNHCLNLAEAERLIDELLTLENPYHCPHGRPTIVSMSKYEMERKFKRIV